MGPPAYAFADLKLNCSNDFLKIGCKMRIKIEERWCYAHCTGLPPASMQYKICKTLKLSVEDVFLLDDQIDDDKTTYSTAGYYLAGMGSNVALNYIYS